MLVMFPWSPQSGKVVRCFIIKEDGVVPDNVYGSEQEDCRRTLNLEPRRLCPILAPGERSEVETRSGRVLGLKEGNGTATFL